jgi:hypothetical protein
VCSITGGGCKGKTMLGSEHFNRRNKEYSAKRLEALGFAAELRPTTTVVYI